MSSLATRNSHFSVARLLRNVPEATRQTLLNSATTIKLKSGQTLFQQGDAGGVMYLLNEGRVEISLLMESGRKVALNLIGPGYCFGEISMADGLPRTAYAVAAENSVLQCLSRDTFFEVAKGCPALLENLLEMLCERLRWVSGSVEEYALLSLHSRLGRRLLVLRENFADAKGTITISQNDLADFAGATREATNKILMEWKNSNIIEVERRAIRVLDSARLEEIAFQFAD